ncbi:hypothetical protein ABC347_07705 [Sphingomonas sp. 1P06PA]|uniref:hypothetical protein n=1 Tax=Sphingomonas sp. 1P06PA TaxID=554121 RepID=UPI0039A5DFEB
MMATLLIVLGTLLMTTAVFDVRLAAGAFMNVAHALHQAYRARTETPEDMRDLLDRMP